MIELAQVTKSHGLRLVLDGFDLTIRSGERVVLSGPSGCGKTTVLRLIAGLLAPDQGTVSLNGQLASRDGRILIPPERRAIGYVFQDLALWPHLTVLENVEFPLKARGVDQKARSSQVSEMLSLVQLQSFAQAYPSSLSGGEQQRVAIARALVARPSFVLMDEPLSNLDEDLRTSLGNCILDLHKRLAFALVYVTHNRDEILQFDGRTIWLGKSKPKANAEL
ncbi:MAG: ABC transporter ATP-binding protein [Acidobacteria bacterium]|nr:ABC transporter ATP-binding protein [Acidobacteriota bacterium]